MSRVNAIIATALIPKNMQIMKMVWSMLVFPKSITGRFLYSKIRPFAIREAT
jgi:hypothetical protein